jgi:hypothetical protein
MTTRALQVVLLTAIGVAAVSGATIIVQETSASVAYAGVWDQGNTDRPWNGGTAAVSTAAQAGMGFDPSGRLYVTRWRLDSDPAHTGNTTEVFDVTGQSLGSFGSGYDFWAGNYESSNVYRFELTTGAVLSAFNTGTPPHTVVSIRVKK